jgi:hypothetical protein
MLAVLASVVALILAGDLSRVARLTDAVVLLSFGAVNLGLVTLGLRRRTPGGRGAWARDAVVAAAATAMCVWLLWHGGLVWVVAAGAVALLGVVWLVARRGGRGR